MADTTHNTDHHAANDAAQPDAQPKSAITALRYGLGQPTNWAEDIDAELLKMNRLWNNLVEIERNNQEQYWEAMSEDPEYGALQGEIDVLREHESRLFDERRERRIQAGSRAASVTADIDSQVDKVHKKLDALYQKAKQVGARRRDESTALKERLREIELDRRALVKKARQESGLFWGNYNAVVTSYERGRRRVLGTRHSLNFRRFEAEGRLVNQIVGGVTAEDLLAGRCSQVGLEITGARGGRQIGVLRVTAYTGRSAGRRHRRNVHFPIVLHRPFPEGSVIKEVGVHIRRRSPTVVDRAYGLEGGPEDMELEYGRMDCSVSFLIRCPHESIAEDCGDGVAGINISWKRDGDGVRVATAAMPDGRVEHMAVPPEWLRRTKDIEEITSKKEIAANEMHARLVSGLLNMDLPTTREADAEADPDRRLLGRIRRARFAPCRLMDRLAWRLKAGLVEGIDDALAEALEAWRRQNKMRTHAIDGGRRKLLARRNEAYRLFAAKIARQVSHIVVDETDYAEAARVKRRKGEDSEFHDDARYHRHLVSPYALREALKQAITKRGGTFEKHKGVINRCRNCGSDSLRILGTTAVCNNCRSSGDIDGIAAANLRDTVETVSTAA